MDIYYFDMCQIVMREYDAKLIIGLYDPEHRQDNQQSFKKLAALYMSLAQAKVLHHSLEKSIKQHEKRVGKIKFPEQAPDEKRKMQ